MIVVTGGAGFIGSNLVHELATRGATDEIVVVDNLQTAEKFRNLDGFPLAHYTDKADFIELVEADDATLASVRCVFHQGACSSTTESDGRYLMKNNYAYSRQLLQWCQRKSIPFIYASSAAIYGGTNSFRESIECEGALNAYGYSKQVFDNFVRTILPTRRAQIVGLRYFNVYGPRESHKGAMASVAFHFDRQLRDTGVVKLFTGTNGYSDGEQRRDFVFVGDVVRVLLWFLDHPKVSGIFNVGTGRSQTFNDVARAVVNYHHQGQIEYVPFPKQLEGKYQSFTEADLTQLRAAGYDGAFSTVEAGVPRYLDWLDKQRAESASSTRS